ncbi:MAG: adenylate/guanylate cyclase domain-containing protein [Alphaproteobacteria bacterium]
MAETAPRKLAAILAADVVGYSRLMGQDEDATVRTLSDYRAVIGEAVSHHEGRVFGGAGDSLVAEFSSPVQAVRCALAIQEGIAARNESLPEDRRMRFRIGVNLGDVIVDGDNLLGDGVNVAARLEGLATPGGICITASVYDQIRNRIDAPITDLGRQTFKNIDQPVRVFGVGAHQPRRRRRSVRLTAALAVAAAVILGAVFFLGGETPPPANAAPVLVVYPFDPIGEDNRLVQIGDGLRQDLMISLSDANARLRIVAVATRSIPADPPPDYVLDGSVRIAGDTVRVTALLVEQRSGYQLWGGRFDRRTDAGLTFQDDIAGKIADSLTGKLAVAEAERARPPGALASVVNGLAMVGRFTRRAAAFPFDLYRRVVGAADIPADTKLSALPVGKVLS